MSYEDDSTVLFDVTNSWESNKCSTGYQGNSNTKSYPDACKFKSSSNSTCFNGVKSVVYKITHSQDGKSSITNVTAAIVVSNVQFSTSVISQSFTVEFISRSGLASDTTDNGNIVHRY